MSHNPLYDLMYKGESGAAGYNAYNKGTYTGADGKQHIRAGSPPLDFSTMTLGQVQDLQHLGRRDPDRVFAVGKYQMIPGTMDAAVAALKLDRNQPFTPELQDRMFSEYLMKDKQKTVRDYISGKTNDLSAAQTGLAMEWASFGDPNKGGRSYHGGANQAHISLAESEAALKQLRAQYQEAKDKGLSDTEAWRTATAINPGQTQTVPAGKTEPQTQTQTQTKPGDTGTWPAPGNYTINKADKPGEGNGEWHSRTGGKHEGIDIVGKEGDRIESFGPGKVVFSGVMRGYGNTVIVQHDNGLQTVYAHLKTRDVDVNDRVTKDTQVGTMGRTGNTPSGGDTHLHFEIREGANGRILGGQTVNPRKYLTFPGQEEKVQPGGKTDPQKPQTTDKAERPSRAMADGVLKDKDQGPEVKALQASLNKLGYRGQDGKPLETNSGVFGANTKHAVEEFQKAHGLKPVDGIVGKDTTAALARADKQPLVSEKTHSGNELYTAIGKQLPPGTKPEVIAGATVQALENGITSADKLDKVTLSGNDAWLSSKTPGFHTRVALDAPTASLQQNSDFIAKEVREKQQTPTETPEKKVAAPVQ